MPTSPDRTRDTLTRVLLMKPRCPGARDREASVGAERDCLVHVSDCALPLSDDLCRVVRLGDGRSARRAFRKAPCEQQRGARQPNGAHDAGHFGCAICPSQPPYYRASRRPWPRAPPHGTCGGCPQCSRAWVGLQAHPIHRIGDDLRYRKLRNHLWFAGMTYQGARFMLVTAIASS